MSRPWRTGMRPVAGSATLVSLRWLLFVVAALPALAASTVGIGDGIADRPYFADAPDPLPMVPLILLLERLPGAVWGAVALAAGVAWVGNLLLTAGAVAIFSAPRGRRPRVWRTVFGAGTRALWPYLRIALVALVAAALGARLIGAAGERLLDHGREALWTMRALFLVQVGRGLATLCWLTLVGLFAWWCRLIVVADERQRVRRLPTLVLRLWWRRPLSAVLGHLVLALGALAAGSAVLFAWRQSPAGPVGWALLWLLTLLALACVWHWRLRAGRLLWSDSDLLDLRAAPDTPWGLRSRLLAWPRGRGQAAAVPKTGTSELPAAAGGPPAERP